MEEGTEGRKVERRWRAKGGRSRGRWADGWTEKGTEDGKMDGGLREVQRRGVRKNRA